MATTKGWDPQPTATLQLTVGARWRLTVVDGARSESFPLPGSGTRIVGRSRSADVVIDHPAISRQHFRIEIDGGVKVVDLGSRNGVWLGGALLAANVATEVGGGETFRIGPLVLLVHRSHDAQEEAPRATDKERGGAMAALWEMVARVAASPLNILVRGETGAGKDVVAQEIHRRSPRAAKPLLRLNCASLSPSLLESELFGHERGAFTGATHAKPGLLETADGGTVFFDEVGDMPIELQARLLRFLEDREVRRVGALRSRTVDVRFISATHRDLEAAIAVGRFRQDLYFRLNGMSLVVPPLRERREEIEDLSRKLLDEAARRMGDARAPAIASAALAALRAHEWQGNVRELRNTLERALALSGGGEIGVEHLLLARSSADSSTPSGDSDPERQRLIDALEQVAGNQTAAARLLGVSRTTLVKRLERYQLSRPRKPSR